LPHHSILNWRRTFLYTSIL